MYVLSAEDLYYKIGKSKNPKQRVKSFTSLPFQIALIHQIKTNDAPWLETYLHNRFLDKRVRGEWFRLDKEEVEGLLAYTEYNRFLCSLKVINAPPFRRPVKPVKKKYPFFNIRLEEEYQDLCGQAAARYKQSNAEYIRQALEDRLVSDGLLTQAQVDANRQKPYREYQRESST